MSANDEVTGRARGGKARAAKMTPEERSAAARKAALAKKELADLPKATHTGTLKIGDMEIPCAVLPDGKRVLSQSGIQNALGRKAGGTDYKAVELSEAEGGGRLPVYLSSVLLRRHISKELEAVVSSPIRYVNPQSKTVAYGFDAAFLPKLCDVWLKAREAGELSKSKAQLATALRAEILMRGLAHVGIIALVDEATGFQRDRARDALAKILEAFVAKELQPYVRTFPPEYYEELFRIYNLPWPPEGNKSWRPSFLGNVTNNVVYSRLAPELLPELKKAATKAEKRSRLHQWLTSDVGHPKLREHLASIVTLLKLARTPREFQELVERIHPRFGDTYQIDFESRDG